MKNKTLPPCIKNAVWWQNPEELDFEKDKKMLIKAVLQKGNFEAMKWIKNQYSKSEMKKVFLNTYESEYSPKTLNFWKVVFNASPLFKSRIDKINASVV